MFFKLLYTKKLDNYSSLTISWLKKRKLEIDKKIKKIINKKKKIQMKTLNNLQFFEENK